jgi:hypothetical protein
VQKSMLSRLTTCGLSVTFLLIAHQAQAVFGTIVTPFKFEARLVQNGKALPEKVIAFHNGNSGAEPFWPWRTHFTSDASGQIPAFVFSGSGAVTIMTKRLRETKLLMALNTKSQSVRFYALEIKVGRLGTRVHCYTNKANNPDDLVYKRGELSDCGALRFSAQATAITQDRNLGWRVVLVIDAAQEAPDLL